MSKRTRRDVFTPSLSIATHRVPRYTALPRVSYKTNHFALSLIEDRRTSYPGPSPYKRQVAAFTTAKGPARLVVKQNPRYHAPSQTKGVVTFSEPKKLPLCVRRSIREEVLFAKGVAGSKRPQRKPRKNEYSGVSCK